MHQSLSTVLFSGYRRRVLGLLFLRPDEWLHGRDIARRIGLAPGSVLRELKRLAEVALLEREARGREINPKVFSPREWSAKTKAKNPFTTDVLRKPKVFLVGDEDELARLGAGVASRKSSRPLKR